MAISQRERVLQLAKRHPLFSASEVRERGVHTGVLTALVRDGTIERAGRGTYRLTGRELTQHHGFALAAAAVPDGIICLLSSLAFHGIGTQLPSEVWIALGRRSWKPRIDYPRLRIVLFSGQALTSGVEEHVLEGRKVRIYGVAKTIADCFKYRNKIGLDVALEALTDAWRSRRVPIPELERYARICRVQNVIRPYLEALTV